MKNARNDHNVLEMVKACAYTPIDDAWLPAGRTIARIIATVLRDSDLNDMFQRGPLSVETITKKRGVSIAVSWIGSGGQMGV